MSLQVEVYCGPRAIRRLCEIRTDYRSSEYVPVVLDGTIVGHIAIDDMLPG